MNSNTQTLQSSQFLSPTRSPRRNKGAEHFSGEGLFDPEAAGGVPEGFPLGGEVAVPGGDAWMLVMCEGEGEDWGGRLGEGMGVFRVMRGTRGMEMEMEMERGCTEEETVVLGQSIGGCDRDIRFRRSIHLLQHLLRQSLRNSKVRNPP